jgi:hypothetical protein
VYAIAVASGNAVKLRVVDAGIKPLKRKKKANGMGAVKIADHPPQFKPTAQAVTYS